MSRRWKIVAFAAAAVVAIVAAAAVALAMGVDANLLKARVEAGVQASSGRPLTIGSAQLSYFPTFGARFDDLSLGEPAGFPDTPSATVSRCSVSVKLLPLLLHRRIEVGEVELTGVGLHLIKLADGRKNWTGWRAAAEPSPADPANPATPADAKSVSPLPRDGVGGFDIGKLVVEKAALRFEDLGRHRGWTVEQLNLTTQDIRPDQPIDYTLDFIAHFGTPETTLKTAMTGRFSRSADLLNFDPLRLQVDASGPHIPEDLGSILFTGRIESERAKHALDLRADQLSVAGISGSLSGDVTDLGGESPGFKGKLKLTPFSPRTLLARLHRAPPRNVDPKIYDSLAFQSDLEIDAGQAMLRNIVAQLDTMHFDGWLGLTDRSRKRYGFSLGIDTLDIDRYRARSAPKKNSEAEAKAAARRARPDNSDTSQPIDLARLDRLNGAGDLAVGQLIFHGATIEHAKLHLDAIPGGPKHQHLSGALYGGTLDESTEVSPGRTGEPVYRQQAHLASVNIGHLLRDVEKRDLLDAVGNADIDFVASGNTRDDLRRSLSGPVAIALRDVTLKGIGLESMARKAVERGLGGGHGDHSLGDSGGQTHFSDVSLDGRFDDGVLDVKTLQAIAERFQLKGHGSADFVQRQLNLHLEPKLNAKDAGPLIARLSQIELPILVSGPFEHPQFKLEDTAQPGSAGESPREQLRNRLRGLLLQRSDRSQQPAPSPDPGT